MSVQFESVQQMRHDWAMSDSARDEGLIAPESIEQFKDISYGADPKWNLLDVYRPKKTEDVWKGHDTLPVIVSIHGGGWFYGDKELYSFYCMDLAERGFITINFNYHLSPENRYPKHMADISRVMAWLVRHGKEYGCDMDRLYIIGDSAGANMCALYCELATNRSYCEDWAKVFADDFSEAYGLSDEEIPAKIPVVPTGLKIRGAGLHCGIYGCFDDYHKDPEAGSTYTNMFEEPTDRLLHLIDATEHVTPAFPPTFIFTAENDFLVDQMPLMVAEFEANNVMYRATTYGIGIPEAAHVFHVNLKLPEGRKANDEECDFFHQI